MLPTQRMLKAMKKSCIPRIASNAAVRKPPGPLSLVNKVAPPAAIVTRVKSGGIGQDLNKIADEATNCDANDGRDFLKFISAHSKVEFNGADSPSAYSKMLVKSVPEELYDDLKPEYHQSLMSLMRNSKDMVPFKWVGLGRSIFCDIDSNDWKEGMTMLFRTLMIVDLGDGGYQVRYGVSRRPHSGVDLSDIFARLSHCDMMVWGRNNNTPSFSISSLDFPDWASAQLYIKGRFDDLPREDKRLAKRDASHRTTASDGLNAMTTNFLLRANVSQEVLRKYLLGRHDEEGYPSGYLLELHQKILMNYAYARFFYGKDGIRSPSDSEMLKWPVLTLLPSYLDCSMEDCYPTPRVQGVEHKDRKQPPLPLQPPQEKNLRPRN